MRKLFLFAFAVFAFAACTQNDVEELSSNRADVPETLTVGFEGGDTRIQLYEAQKTVWTKGDQVSVFYKSYDNLKFEFEGNTGDRNGTLKRVGGQHNGQTMDDVVVVYPYSTDYMITLSEGCVNATIPSTQTYLKGSYGVGDNLMIASSSFNQFSLKSVCGWLKLQLTGNGETIKSITFRGNDDEQVAGLVYVDATTAEATLATAKHNSDDNSQLDGTIVLDDSIYTEVILDCGEGVVLGTEATSFYFALPPQTFEQGVAVEILCDGYKPMTLATTSEVVIERNHIKPMEVVEFEAEEGEGSEIPKNEIWYTATAKVEAHSDQPWSLDTFGANVVSHEWDSESGEGVITFDADVTTIGYCAFYSCDSLTSITIPDCVTTIGTFAFKGCDSLTSITIPDSVTTIGLYAFDFCDSLTEFKGKLASEDGRCLIVDGTLNSFAPAGLTSYTIPDSVTTIGEYAFNECNSLESVTIPDSVTTIGEAAFYICNSLTSITIPDSVTTIGNSAFAYCTNIVEFNGKFASEDGRCLIIDGTLNSFALGCGATEYTIPDSVTTIGKHAFASCSSLTSVTIGDSVTTIGEYAFSWCHSLTSVYCEATTPPSLGGSDVFDYNASGRLIYVPTESVEAYKSAENWSEYADAIVGYDVENGVVIDPNKKILYTATAKVEAPSDNPWSLDTFGANVVSNEWDSESGEGIITFDADVTTIGYAAFYYCDLLTSITIPDSVTTIGDFTFYCCKNLTSVTIPDSVTTTGQYAFDYCDSLTEFKGKLASEDGRCLIIDGVLYNFAPAGLTSYTIPNSVTAIGRNVFINCHNLTSITIPDSVTSIGEYGFYGCNNLTSITIPDSVTTIGNSAFTYCMKLTEFNGKFASEDGRCLIVDGTLNTFAFGCGATEYTIPDSVTTIGEHAFSACYNLTSVTIPDSVTTIGEYAFTDCNNLTSITIPDSVTTIGRAAFYNCNSLTSVTIGDSVTTIGDEAFYSCDSLASVTIGNSVTTIGRDAFQYCNSLTSLYCEATLPPSLGESSVFDNNASGRTIYVPAASVVAYKTAEYWSEYADYIIGYDFENGVVVE